MERRLPLIEEKEIRELKECPNINSVKFKDNKLYIKSAHGRNNLVQILDYLNKEEISYNQIITEMPTLNDVFLEITGKELRD